MLSTTGVIVALAVIALGCLMWAAKEQRERWEAKNQYVSSLACLEGQLRDIKADREQWANNGRTRYVTIDAFDDTHIDYVRTLARVAEMPEVRFFIHALSMAAHERLTSDSNDLEAKRRWAYYIEAYGAEQDALAAYKRKYDAMTTEQEPEEDNAEISLS